MRFWHNERVGAGLRILEFYGNFPTKTKFKEPTHIPIPVQWGRFRLESKVRLVGFTIPADYHKKLDKNTDEYFDKNTFYVVFLDQNHEFYYTEKK